MTPEDANRIEDALGISLPHDYRQLLLNYPVVYDRGTKHGDLWDDADAIIKRNEELRSKRKSFGTEYEALPNQYLFVGDDGGGWQHLIDLQTDPPIVHVMEFEAIGTISPATDGDGDPQSLRDWFHDRLIDMRDGGIDISSTEHPAGKITFGCVAAVLVFCLIVAIVLVLMIAGVQYVLGG